MPEFLYEAITRGGQRESATIVAQSAAAAGRLLKEQGLLPTEIKEKTGKTFLDKLKTLSSVPLAEKIGFVENLGIMLKAGIPLSRSLGILVKQSKNPRFKEIITDIHSQIESGQQLGDSMAKYPTVFSKIFTSMVRVGELSGNLEQSLDYLTKQLQREADLKSKVKGAMMYPSVIIVAMLVIGVLMAIFVLPKLTGSLKELGGDLPALTRGVIWIADNASAHAVLTIGLMIAVGAAAYMFLRTATGKRALDEFLLRFFLVNVIVKKINLARFARIMSSLLKSGIPIVQGLEVTGEALDNIPFAEVVQRSALDVRVGKPLSETLAKHERLFPIIVVQMLQVGEESGTVETILEEIAQQYEEQVDTTLRNLSSIIEPLLLLTIGVVVGFLAVALISPIYSVGNNIK